MAGSNPKSQLQAECDSESNRRLTQMDANMENKAEVGMEKNDLNDPLD